MASLEAISWDDVRFVSINELTVRVLLNDQSVEFNFASREEMEDALCRWFVPSAEGRISHSPSWKGS